ncbi:MAG: FxsA family protein [Pseudomonadota bacterium]|nr:FxsA family protein [Pseudomonadota bacterium]
MNTFFLIFVVLPALEIFFMIKIGSEIGALSTLVLIFLTAVLGVFFARVQGIQTLKSGLINLYQNKVPIYELISGASIAFAAVLLIIPGFLTDLIGFILLIPFTRRVLIKMIFKNRTTIDKHKEKIDTIDGEIVKKEKDEL